jgi:NADPH:quinone reductase-like Zn-dependent oxidoreductase
MKAVIYGASGSLGTAAVQLAKYFGAEVIGVCSTANVELVKSLGADKVIDYLNQDLNGINQVYGVIYDTIGKSPFFKSL